MKNRILSLFLIIITGLFSSCWPDDDQIIPIEEKITKGTKLVALPYSIYTEQTFYNLRSNQLVSYNAMDDWDLGFESSINGKHIILNTADVLEVANVGVQDFSYNQVPDDSLFTYDASSGNFDSLAIHGWLSNEIFPYEYSGNLYFLGKTDGVSYSIYKKFKVLALSDTSYTLVIGNLNDNQGDTAIIMKNPLVGFTKVKMIDTPLEVKIIEPNISDWDIVFTQYATILYTDEGVATDYIVRGTLINPFQTRVARFRIDEQLVVKETDVQSYFSQLDASIIDSLQFASNWDVIGWDWKDVTVDESTNTSTYKADPRKVYIIQTQDGSYYKLHFTSFYNLQGIKGFPAFEYVKIEE